MLKIGLTGGIGSGKSAAAKMFESLGIRTIDADIVAREVVEPGTHALKRISEHYGSDILNELGELNRAKLRHIIFSDTREKSWLEDLLHPLINESISDQLNRVNSAYAILVSPLLFETNQDDLVDRTLLIDLDTERQIERACARDQADTKHIQRIIDSQMSRDKKLALADDIICNDKDFAHLQKEVEQMHHYYLTLTT